MMRRQFITFLAGATAWPLLAHAQQIERMPRVGVWRRHTDAAKNSGPPTDAGATNFVRSTQAHSGLQCPELAQLRPQIVPWSTLCRADWVRNGPVLTTRGWLLRHYDPVSPGAARGHAAASEHQGVSLMGLGKRGRLRVDQPTITG
jgi:hypothetical protein